MGNNAADSDLEAMVLEAYGETFDLLEGIARFSEFVENNAVLKGFREVDHPPTRENIAVFVANLHAEVSEFWEAFRADKLTRPCDKAEKMVEAGLPVLTCAEEELADVCIRVFDTAKANGVDLGRAIVLKHLFNLGRPYQHGSKKA